MFLPGSALASGLKHAEGHAPGAAVRHQVRLLRDRLHVFYDGSRLGGVVV